MYMSRYVDILAKKLNSVLTAESTLNALHDVRQVRLGHAVVGLAALSFRFKQSTVFHQTEVAGGNVTLDLTGLCQLTDGVTRVEQHLDHSQSVWMSDRPQAFGRHLKLV